MLQNIETRLRGVTLEAPIFSVHHNSTKSMAAWLPLKHLEWFGQEFIHSPNEHLVPLTRPAARPIPARGRGISSGRRGDGTGRVMYNSHQWISPPTRIPNGKRC